jgi:DNA primase
MALAAEFYVGALWERAGEKGRTYLEQRGVDPEMGAPLRAGLRPRGLESLLSGDGAPGISEDLVVQAGLALPRQNQPGFYDRFRGRLLFSTATCRAGWWPSAGARSRARSRSTSTRRDRALRQGPDALRARRGRTGMRERDGRPSSSRAISTA